MSGSEFYIMRLGCLRMTREHTTTRITLKGLIREKRKLKRESAERLQLISNSNVRDVPPGSQINRNLQENVQDEQITSLGAFTERKRVSLLLLVFPFKLKYITFMCLIMKP